MNHHLWTKVGARVIALAFVVAGAAACDSVSHTSSRTPAQPAATGSAQVVGTVPAQPSGDPPGTTPVAGNTTDVTKAQESMGKPAEGDNHSYSTVSPTSPQKADGKNATGSDERKAQ